MPQNISVVIIDSDSDSINSMEKELSLRVKLRGEAEANSEIRRFGRKNLRNLAFSEEIATVETTSQ